MYRRSARVAAALVLGVALSGLLAASAAAETLAPLDSREIRSQVHGTEPAHYYVAQGNVSAPGGAVEARFELDWNVTGAAPADEITFSVCAGPCSGNATVNHTTHTPPLNWTTEIPDTALLGWEAEATGPAPRGVNLTGTVTFLGTPHHGSGHGSGHPADEAGSAQAPPGDDGPGTGTLVAALGAASAAGLAWTLRRWWWPALVGLYSRLSRDELLDNETRRRIRELIDEEPGIHFSEIARRLDLSNGQLEHHLDKLLEHDLVAETRTGQHRCLVIPGQVDPRVVECLPAVKSPGARRVLEASLEGPGSVQAIARRADVAVSTASYHVDRLRDRGLLAADEEGRKLRVEATDLGRQVRDHAEPA